MLQSWLIHTQAEEIMQKIPAMRKERTKIFQHYNFCMLICMTLNITCAQVPSNIASDEKTPVKAISGKPQKEAIMTEDKWKEILEPEAFRVLRQHGTERPFTGKYEQHWEAGQYNCVGCGNPLFKSETKFDAGCGWPSFSNKINPEAVVERVDRSFGMIRTEVLCARCHGHLGHVFPDGPRPTGLRYCINSVCLSFETEQTKDAQKAADSTGAGQNSR